MEGSPARPSVSQPVPAGATRRCAWTGCSGATSQSESRPWRAGSPGCCWCIWGWGWAGPDWRRSSVGNLVGALPVAFAAAIGPVHRAAADGGVASCARSTAGLRLPAFLNWIYCVGWDAVNNVPAAAALLALLALGGFGPPFWLALGVTGRRSRWSPASMATTWCRRCRNISARSCWSRWAAIGLLVADPLRRAARPRPHWPTLPTFILATAILASFNLSWASYSSDYTRYLPADSPTRPKVVVAGAGRVCSARRCRSSCSAC